MVHIDATLPVISGSTRLYGIIGHPVEHSLSPLMQTYAFQYHGLNSLYVPFPVAPARLTQAVTGAVALGIHGFNVTIPHKEHILSILDDLSEEAQFVGAVNTVDIREGRTIGYNTDGSGFLQPLQARNIPWLDTTVCILGAGGAARAITMALLQQGCPSLTVVNRTPERGERLVDALRAQFPHGNIHFRPLSQAAQAARASTLVVNATAVGLHDDAPPLLPDTSFHAKQIVYDIVYRPLYSTLLRTAQHCGATVVPGIDMLIGQGAEAFRLWTGHTFPVESVRRLLQPLIE
jgi:shikimate dehydrogenase